MKWLLKIRDSLDYLYSEIKKYFDSWLLISFAIIIVGVVVYVILMSLSKTAIFPKDKDRYDIDTIYVGQMRDFCPEEFDANPGKKEFESCVPKLDINKMVEVKIPTFKETINVAPNLPYMMKHDSDPKIKEAGNYFRHGNYFVIGIKIPEKYFSIDGGYIKNGRIVNESIDYNVLSFNGMTFGTGCVGSACDVRLHYGSQYVNQIPLIVEKGSNNSDIVWIFGTQLNTPIGLWLDDGIFVTKKLLLLSTHELYGLFNFGKPMFAGIALVALFLVSLPFAFYLRRFFDYPAFSYFAGSTALWFISLNLAILFPWLRGFTYRLFSLWIIFNFLFSILILNLAYSRFKNLLKKRYFIIVHLVLLGLIFSVYFYFGNLGPLVTVWGKLEVTFAFMAFLCATIPLLSGIYVLTKMLKNTKDPRASTRLDYMRRIKELCIYLLVWIVFSYSYIYFAHLGMGTGNISEFFTTSIALFLLLLGIMIYHTHSKEITRMSSDSLAELERLNKRKSPRELTELLEKPFEGVLLLLDMANSSGKDGREKKMVMERLLNLCNREANKVGYYANYVKPAGDDWKIIFIKKNQNLADDLFEVTKFAVDNYHKFENCIKNVFVDSSIHVSIFALSEYVVAIDEKNESDYGYTTMLDFSSKEADLMLKYIEKSNESNTLMVAGKEQFFSNELKSLMKGYEVQFLKDKVQEKHKNVAIELKIVYGLAELK